MIYKNKTDQDLTIPGIGFVKAGGTIETDKKIESVNFEEVKTQPQKPTTPKEGGTKE